MDIHVYKCVCVYVKVVMREKWMYAKEDRGKK
jgi:hypothetical protein